MVAPLPFFSHCARQWLPTNTRKVTAKRSATRSPARSESNGGALLSDSFDGRLWKFVSPSGYVKIAIENGHRNSFCLSMLKMVIFHIYVNVYQRVFCSRSDQTLAQPSRAIDFRQFPSGSQAQGNSIEKNAIYGTSITSTKKKWGIVGRKIT